MGWKSKINPNIIEDKELRQNFVFLLDELSFLFGVHGEPANPGIRWEKFEYVATAPVTDHELSHKLKTIPTDAIFTWVDSSGTPSFGYSKFTSDKFYITVTQPGTYRGLIGVR